MSCAGVIAAPFEFDCGTVPAEWIDRNGHMNVTRYLVASELATVQLYDELDLGMATRERTGCGMFAVEHHLAYKTELVLGDAIVVTSLLLDCSDKAIHFLNAILRARDRRVAAAVENIELHVDLAHRRSAAFPAEVQARLVAVKEAHGASANGAAISRTMTLRRS